MQIGAGDFTFYIKNGWLIEDGKVTAPIRDCNIIGKRAGGTQARDDGRERFKARLRGMDLRKVRTRRSVVSQGLPTVLVSADDRWRHQWPDSLQGRADAAVDLALTSGAGRCVGDRDQRAKHRSAKVRNGKLEKNAAQQLAPAIARALRGRSLCDA